MISRFQINRAVAALAAATALTLGGCSREDTSPASASNPAPSVEMDVKQDGTASGRQLALTCSGCHGSNSLAIPDHSKLDRATLESSLLDYKADADGTTVMHRLMRGYSDADIAMISDYLTQAPEND